MPIQRYLFIRRSSGGAQERPTPAQQQEMHAAFGAWQEKFKGNIVDMGGRLKPGGKVVRASSVTDGPFTEAKELVGGFMIVSAEGYEQELGGKITLLTRHEDQPNQANVPANLKKAILHARLEIGGTVLMGADIPGAEPMRSAYLTLTLDSAKEAERVYALLAEGGQIFT